MSAFKRIAAIAMVTASMSAVLMPVSTPAQARDGFNGAIFGGLAAGALVGGAIAGAGRGYGYAPRPYYEPAPVYVGPRYVEPDCFISKRPIYNRWGDFVGYRRVRECD
ncbi:MAG: hypothetical protein ACK4K8_16865 [Pannonibacter sp.]